MTLVPLEILIVCRGASIAHIDWSRVDANIRLLAVNTVYELVEIKPDMILSDSESLDYNRLNAPAPLYTSTSIPDALHDDRSGMLAIKLARSFSPQNIYCVGMDSITHDSEERLECKIKPWRSGRDKRATQAKYTSLIATSIPTKIRCLGGPELWRQYIYK